MESIKKYPKVEPNTAWVDLTPEQQKTLKPYIQSLSWKHEGSAGPMWVVFNIPSVGFFGNKQSTTMINYADDGSMEDVGNPKRCFAKWYTISAGNKIAQKMGVTFDY